MRSMYGRSDRVNLFASEGVSDLTSAVPSGHLAPSAWLLPQVAGGMASRNEATMSITTTGSGSQGLRAEGSAAMTIATSGSGAAIANGQGSSSLVMTVSNLAAEALQNGSGSASMSLSTSGTISGRGSIQGSSACAFTASLVTGALGEMIMTPISQEISVDAIAEAVWSASDATNVNAGSMGGMVANIKKNTDLIPATL